MALADYLTQQRCLILESSEKSEVIRLLSHAICSDYPELECSEIIRQIDLREEQLSARLARGIALPHMTLTDDRKSILAVGVSRGGIAWDPSTEEKVHLVLLLVGGRSDHLQVLSEIAVQLKQLEIEALALQADSPEQLYSVMNTETAVKGKFVADRNREISRINIEKAISISKDLGGAPLVVYADAVGASGEIEKIKELKNALVVSGEPARFLSLSLDPGRLIHIPFRGLNRSAYIQFTLIFLLSQARIQQDDVVVNLFGLPGAGYFDTIRLTSIEHEIHLPELFGDQAGALYNQHILTRILQISNELAVEGREGKSVGTLFVYGSRDQIHRYSRQMIINPFSGLKEEDRNILDPSLEETIKEYAKIDGAFLIDEDGTIISAGTYIAGLPSDGGLHSGLGARHAAAVGITTVTDTFSVVISESTRKISLYHRGKRLLFM